ncbi:hypothetical protein WDU94_005620, partial [Cyamophila willieti]
VQEIDGNFFERFGSRLKELQENQKVNDEKDGILEDMVVQNVVEPLQAASPQEMITTVIGWNTEKKEGGGGEKRWKGYMKKKNKGDEEEEEGEEEEGEEEDDDDDDG